MYSLPGLDMELQRSARCCCQARSEASSDRGFASGVVSTHWLFDCFRMT